MSEKICMTMKEFEDIACDVVSDIAVQVHKQAKSMGDSEEDAMSVAEGAIVMLSDFVGGIRKKVESVPHRDSPRGFICSKELMPKRATSTSAGYDFVAPRRIVLQALGSEKINTMVKARMLPDEVLKIYQRSSLAIEKRVALVNGVAVIDSDFNDNIVLALVNMSHKTVLIDKGERIAQGIFQKYLTCGDEPSVARNGGIGSTGK